MSTGITQTPEGAQVKTETTVIEMPTGDPIVIQNTTIEMPPSEDWLRDEARISAFFDDPIGYTSGVLNPYKRILTAVGWVLLATAGAWLVLSVLSAVLSIATSIPVLSPLFELIGIVYTGWFIYRYLLTSSQRQELSQKIDAFKSEFVGKS
ncbi:CAAD domain-containing protein [Phormidesmis priestleyi]|uniref:CAAD domain-containing protein n=1 Tax=Phormidesmis priestleyi TaxID=268141 RepID=UPI00083A1002|nr:CAAD domain-containing protein [Phormidesmis priestleyi]